MNTNLKFIDFGGHKYAVELLNPLEGITWGHRAMSLLSPALGSLLTSANLSALMELDVEGDDFTENLAAIQPLLGELFNAYGKLGGDEVSALLTEALQRCYTPRNESLADMSVFNRWFQENPGDLFTLGIIALFHLVKGFFPKPLVTGMSGFPMMEKENRTSA